MGKETGGTILKTVKQAADVAIGNKVDFPTIWKASGWTGDYSVNIRFFNPDPNNEELTMKYIVGPIAALLMFSVPRSDDGKTYYWPWLCKYNIPGLVNVEAGYVKNVTVIKGGDDNKISYGQVPGIVDVKVDFGNLYSVMISLLNSDGISNTDAPTLQRWIQQFKNKKPFVDSIKGQPSWLYRNTTASDNQSAGELIEEAEVEQLINSSIFSTTNTSRDDQALAPRVAQAPTDYWDRNILLTAIAPDVLDKMTEDDANTLLGILDTQIPIETTNYETQVDNINKDEDITEPVRQEKLAYAKSTYDMEMKIGSDNKVKLQKVLAGN